MTQCIFLVGAQFGRVFLGLDALCMEFAHSVAVSMHALHARD